MMQPEEISEIMKHQPIVNIGMIGHVANGKSTITKCLSGKETQKFEKEKERNITIRIGYANVKIWFCHICDAPESYSASDSSLMEKRCKYCNSDLELKNHISIIDCPGHSELIATMLNGSSVMDHAILVESCANEVIPEAQTAEHLTATLSTNIPTAMILMNKIDIVNKKIAHEKIKMMSTFINSKLNRLPPIIPCSATFGINIDVMCQYIGDLKAKNRNTPDQLFKMIVIRSFDINKPGTDLSKLNGGVIGGTIMKGSLKIGEVINIYPGMVKKIPLNEKKENGADFKYEPIQGECLSIQSELNNLTHVFPGGLLAIQLTIDPTFSRNDQLSGSMILKKNDVDTNQNLFKVYDKIVMKQTTFLMDKNKTVALFEDLAELTTKDHQTERPQLMININSNNIDCRVKKYNKKKQELFLYLSRPIAIDMSDNIGTVLNKNVSKDILSCGIIVNGIDCESLI